MSERKGQEYFRRDSLDCLDTATTSGSFSAKSVGVKSCGFVEVICLGRESVFYIEKSKQTH